MATGFQNAVDIGNRGLMHLGKPRISQTLGFNEDSRQASAVAFVYDKLRRAELQRKTWTFATRRAVLRPIDEQTMFVAPTLWSATTTYYVGSIVEDQSGYLWQSNSPDNLNNTPGNSSLWDSYFGPLSVALWDNTGQTTYLSGELVYITAGNGAYQVFSSLSNNNTDNPEVPRQWDPNKTYIKDQLAQRAPAWSSLTTYSAGQMVTYTDGNTYASLIGSNLNKAPPSNLGTAWAAVPTGYFLTAGNPPAEPTPTVQPTAFLEWNATITYSIGSFADIAGKQYVSLVSANLNLPPASNPSSWAQLTNATIYMSLIDANFDQDPLSSPILWSSLTTYASGNQVCGSDGVIYTSSTNSNTNNNPTTDGGVHWTNTGTLCPWTSTGLTNQGLSGSGSSKWLAITAALSEKAIVYPIGSGPIQDTRTRNVYRLPANYLRKAPQAPRSDVSFLGAPTDRTYNDWEFENGFLVTWCATPIVFRFIADFTDVTKMHDMFCEGLGARIGYECCEELTQSTAKQGACANAYQKFMTEARTVNAIEDGPEAAPQDDLITCRY